MPKISVTPSALRLSIRASAALIAALSRCSHRTRDGTSGPFPDRVALCLASRGFGRVPAGVRIDRRLDRVALVALDRVDDGVDQLLDEQRGLAGEAGERGG